MGQYYVIANLDKKQYLHPHRFGDGLKLLEFGASGQGTMTGLAILLASGNGRGGGDLHSEDPIIGSWAGDRIVVTGDYADPGLFTSPEYSAGTLYEEAQHGGSGWVDISYPVLAAMADDGYLADTLAQTIGPDSWNWERGEDGSKGAMPAKLRRLLVKAAKERKAREAA